MMRMKIRDFLFTVNRRGFPLLCIYLLRKCEPAYIKVQETKKGKESKQISKNYKMASSHCCMEGKYMLYGCKLLCE